MTKGPPIRTPRPDRPPVRIDDLPWRTDDGRGGAAPSRCAARTLTVELLEPIVSTVSVVAVSAGGAVRIISNGMVCAALAPGVSAEMLACMQDGWRYSGELTPITASTGQLSLVGQLLE